MAEPGRPIVIITGPTACGKGAVARHLAGALGGEIVSVDSMKVFRGLDIGTAKPDPALRARIPHHLIDIVDPGEEFSLGSFVRLVLQAIGELVARGRRPILCGGTSLYLWGLTNGVFEGPQADWSYRRRLEADPAGLPGLYARLQAIDPAAAARIHPNDRRRIVRALEVFHLTGVPISRCWAEGSIRLEEGSYRMFGIRRDRQALYRRIDERVLRMVEEGLFAEAERLEPFLGHTASQCLGYRQICEGRRQGLSREEIIARVQRDTRRFAKRQFTWMKRFPIEWLDADGEEPEGIAGRILRLLCMPSRRESPGG